MFGRKRAVRRSRVRYLVCGEVIRFDGETCRFQRPQHTNRHTRIFPPISTILTIFVKMLINQLSYGAVPGTSTENSKFKLTNIYIRKPPEENNSYALQFKPAKSPSKFASSRNIRRGLEECVTVIYIKNSNFFIAKVPFSDSTTIESLKEVVASQMNLHNTEGLEVMILPHGCKWYDTRLSSLRESDWKKAEELILSIRPKSTIRKDSRIGYPRATCFSGSDFTLRQLLYPWKPAKVEFFVGFKDSPLAIPKERPNSMTIYHQMQKLLSASEIRGRSERAQENRTVLFDLCVGEAKELIFAHSTSSGPSSFDSPVMSFPIDSNVANQTTWRH
ncbi:hypothetical protein TWF506_010509 [Arthrobotrys conoides]|uniref:Uncharacterized protein n=1 Tax=Arthrobotrys conoides TaxID=74498 RepID=A0AAN8NRM4_9PEZI